MSAQVLSLLPFFQVSVKTRRVRQILAPDIDKLIPWGFSDEASQDNGTVCGIKCLLFMNEDHYFSGKALLGQGTNNFGEFQALLFLLKSALAKGIRNL